MSYGYGNNQGGSGYGGGGQQRQPNPMYSPLFVKFASGDKAKVGYVTRTKTKDGKPLVNLTIDLKGQPAGIQALMAALNVSDPSKGLKLFAFVPEVEFSRGGAPRVGGGGGAAQGWQQWQQPQAPQQAWGQQPPQMIQQPPQPQQQWQQQPPAPAYPQQPSAPAQAAPVQQQPQQAPQAAAQPFDDEIPF